MVDDSDPLYLEELNHERMKAWMLDHGWSLSICADPCDLVEMFHDMLDDDSDSDDVYTLSTKL